MTKSPARVYICQQCGKEQLKWMGRCPKCGQWNTFVETTLQPSSSPANISLSTPVELSSLKPEAVQRLVLPLPEFNRVLGGGLVPGSLVLVSGDPGIGKSTLLLQVSALATGAGNKVVYVTAEETLQQIKLRADRLKVGGNNLFPIAETDLSNILGQMEQIQPDMAVVDSIQAIQMSEIESAPGSVNQVRECTVRLMHWAKQNNVPVLITGHVTKDGTIAGPKTLEHIVDVVLYFEGEAYSAYRLLRGIKNRFGSTNEIGVFEMGECGLAEVQNPSQAFISRRSDDSVGSIVVATMEGSRPLLVEIQALTNPTSFGLPRRTTSGVDFNRLLLITAVLGKRLGLKLGSQDIIVNVTGGLRIQEPAADLGIALAIASSFRESPADPHLVAIGEIGLSGEIRNVAQLDRRVSEAARLGFKRCIVPGSARTCQVAGIDVAPVTTLREAARTALAANPA